MTAPDANPLTAHGFDEVTGRQLFSLALASTAELPESIDLGSTHFACMLAWDASGVPDDSIATLVERLLRAGASYFVCWGPDAERVEGIVDELVASMDDELGVPDDSTIMSTSHESEPLEEALWFFLVNAWPADHYVDSTRAALAIAIGSSRLAEEIGAALDDVRGFVERVSASGIA